MAATASQYRLTVFDTRTDRQTWDDGYDCTIQLRLGMSAKSRWCAKMAVGFSLSILFADMPICG